MKRDTRLVIFYTAVYLQWTGRFLFLNLLFLIYQTHLNVFLEINAILSLEQLCSGAGGNLFLNLLFVTYKTHLYVFLKIYTNSVLSSVAGDETDL